jgi:hypothetical protein
MNCNLVPKAVSNKNKMGDEGRFQQVRTEYGTILQKIAEIEIERREYSLVMATLKQQ